MPVGPVPDWALQVGVILAVFLSGLLISRLDGEPWRRHLRTRLLLGVPFGTLTVCLMLVGVYLVVQRGIAHPNAPVVVAFRAWSYFYPLGMVFAGLAHANPGHLLGNLLGTIVLGSFAEYAYGHYPRRRGTSSFGSFRTNPYARAFLFVPGAAVVAAFVTSLLSWGPVIGFSGVVFAFVGFALVRYPVGAVIAFVAQRVVRTVVSALQDPVLVAKAEPSFGPPWWAGISIQGHLLGLFLGILVGILLLRRDGGETHPVPTAGRLWGASMVLATSLSLWALWWFRGGSTYVLYRGPGVVFVIVLALGITLAVRGAISDRAVREGFRYRDAAVLLVVFPVLVVGIAAVPLNFTTVADAASPGEGPPAEVGDYSVTYAENVTNEMVSVVNLTVFGETTRVNTSGAIVISERRHLWTRSLSKGRLAFRGNGSVVVGGLGWRESVDFSREGWSVNGTPAYVVSMRPPDGQWRHAYSSDPVTAEPVLDGRNVTVVPTADGFELAIARRGSELARTNLPPTNETVRAGGLRFTRDGDGLYARVNRTRVRLATQETYHSE